LDEVDDTSNPQDRPNMPAIDDLSFGYRALRAAPRVSGLSRSDLLRWRLAGTANFFMMFAPLEGWRHVKVSDRHTAVDCAHVLKDLADVHFANAKTIVLVQDNLNIHSKASLYEAFPAAEARQRVDCFEWHYTPKHGRPHRRRCGTQ
jgi:hypothetical protein